MEEKEIKSLIESGYYGAKSNYKLEEIFKDCKYLQNKCNHNWVYSYELLLINPPKKKRVCAKCGLKETVFIGYTNPHKEEYDDVVKRFTSEVQDD